MEGTKVIEAEGRTLKEAIENACQELGIGKQALQYRLCAEHFRFGADTVRIEAWRKEESGDEAALVKELLEGILSRMKMGARIDVQTKSGSLVASLELEQASVVVAGRLRQVLDALQHVVNKALVRRGSTKRVVVDLEDYREKHDQGLRYIAQKVCEKVLKEGCVVTLKPMNAYDRRLVHLEVARFPELGSRSGGEGQMKRVQVFPLSNSSTEKAS